MAWETAEPPPSNRSEVAQIGPRAEPGEEPRGERFVAIAIERRAKDDGRALILYRHAGVAQP